MGRTLVRPHTLEGVSQPLSRIFRPLSTVHGALGLTCPPEDACSDHIAPRLGAWEAQWLGLLLLFSPSGPNNLSLFKFGVHKIDSKIR